MAAEFFLLGDSHIQSVAKAAKARGLTFRGGQLGLGLDLEKPFFECCDDGLELLTGAPAKIKDDFRDVLKTELPILCAMGVNSRRFARRLDAYVKEAGAHNWREVLSEGAFLTTIADLRQPVFRFFRTLIEHDKTVYFLPSPQIVSDELRPVFLECEEFVIHQIKELGARFVDTRPLVPDPAEYRIPGDSAHANEHYGALALDAFFNAVRVRKGS